MRAVIDWIRAWAGRGFKPFVFCRTERFLLRLLTAATIFFLPGPGEDLDRQSLPEPGKFDLTSQPHPNGIAHLIDLSWIGEPHAHPRTIAVRTEQSKSWPQK